MGCGWESGVRDCDCVGVTVLVCETEGVDECWCLAIQHFPIGLTGHELCVCMNHRLKTDVLPFHFVPSDVSVFLCIK